MPSIPDARCALWGAGTRLRTVNGDQPKVMARVAGRPFLELLLRQLRRNGFERVILAVGYRWEVIQEHFGEHSAGLKLAYAVESSPLGTGGALRNAFALVESDGVVALNGDSYTNADLPGLVAVHRECRAGVSMVVVPADGRTDCGLVRVDASGRVEKFEEKKVPSGREYVNAGIYMISWGLLAESLAGPLGVTGAGALPAMAGAW